VGKQRGAASPEGAKDYGPSAPIYVAVLFGGSILRANCVKMSGIDMTLLPKRGDVDLEGRVRNDMAFLFEEHGATVSANTLQAFGNSEITVTVGNLEFQFAKNDRDQEFKVRVAPSNGTGVWELPHVALAASTGEDAATLIVPISYNDDPAAVSYIGLTRLAAELKPRFERLNRAFAPENYPATHFRMVQIERAVHPK
jgi:hypothetical protein